MRKSDKPFLKAFSSEPAKQRPIWLMRQAGRYLPEYRHLRSQAENFLSFCLTPSLAAEATMQPIDRFGFDAAILFADILLIPHALGQRVTFVEGEGPRLEPLQQTDFLAWEEPRIAPVYETIKRVKDRLPTQTSLIGFCGGLWTVACYMIDGQGGAFEKSRALVRSNPAFVHRLLTKLHEASFVYLCGQIKAGAEALQLFESHAGLLSGEDFENFVIDPTRKLVADIKKLYPDVPVIGFPRGASHQDYVLYAQKTGVDALSLDQSVPLSFAQEQLQPDLVLQGNLDPALLLQGGTGMKNAAEQIVQTLGPRHIFNLGHGVIKETPPEHVKELVDFVRSLS